MNTITSPLTLLPLAGAWLANVAGMTVLFAVIVLGGVLAIAGALYMQPAAGIGEDAAGDADGPPAGAAGPSAR